ncbi:MAG: valine--tRNA ligase [Gammaproteobacteria bacterium CG11_big_fil_rev_8_21_14_0_20_46_22]|nr:MAG: valine--tRNA ligase [Gammaproteobacteria bacterium CG12_big_fil_rev_8_21_14_0_65_46_12]PIR11233.1 MAG: valine--tRNA ligase [Gammaproteobacteria bacterium CG11_big_fil_rev_8_21_14_0_20_46_22]
MDKTYQPKDIEQSLYQQWENSGYFKPSGQGEPYAIVIPPPNVTGSLHMGHGFQQTIMDVLTRYHRMQGCNTLWQPGTDHAGISTQMVVERQLMAAGQTRQDLGREAFEEKVWAWKEQSGSTIVKQSRRLGISPDWSRERFTMDDDLSEAVKKVFVDLYREGLIYKGQRLVNWDPKLQTAISDLEVISKPQQGSIWHIRYPLANGEGFLEVATTRPETLLGDTAIAVNPEDERYQHLIGQMVRVPLCDRLIPVIADDYVDAEFGTGCVKITPAHDFNDYEVGTRHGLPMITVIDKQAHINENAPEKYQGLERFAARKQIVADLDAEGLLANIEKHDNMVPYGDKSGVIVEPLLTEQWYMKMQPLALPAIKAVEDGRIRFIPENWNKTYFQWLNNIQDWCISRQLWWGHRIPAWYDEKGRVYVGHDEADVRAHYTLDESVTLTQDEDVLDTWFSSALWPFSTLGWPKDTDELHTFFPTSVLVTGFDIIFFWVARMIMLSLKFMGDVPFRDVYIHGLIRDEEGQKMSKTKGNVLDPIDLIDGVDLDTLIQKRTFGMMQPELAEKITQRTEKQYPNGIEPHGTDALRFTYCALANNARDINFDIKRLEGYRNFCNKLWNAARFVLMQTDNQAIRAPSTLGLADRWLQSRLQSTLSRIEKTVAEYRFDYYAQAVYDYTWHDVCDWYIELQKIALNSEAVSETDKAGIRYQLLSSLEQLLRVLHPIMPFITESIWQSIKQPLSIEADTIMLQHYPVRDAALIDESAEASIDWLKAVTLAVRNVRGEMNIAPSTSLKVTFKAGNANDQAQFATTKDLLLAMAKLDSIDFSNTLPAQTATQIVGELEVHVDLEGLIDFDAERARLEKEIQKLDANIARLEGKLNNPSFVDKAPDAVVAKEREKLAQEHSAKAALAAQWAKLS